MRCKGRFSNRPCSPIILAWDYVPTRKLRKRLSLSKIKPNKFAYNYLRQMSMTMLPCMLNTDTFIQESCLWKRIFFILIIKMAHICRRKKLIELLIRITTDWLIHSSCIYCTRPGPSTRKRKLQISVMTFSTSYIGWLVFILADIIGLLCRRVNFTSLPPSRINFWNLVTFDQYIMHPDIHF